MKAYHVTLMHRAERIISGETSLEEEMRTASTTECITLCLIMDRSDHLLDGDLLRAWGRLDADQQKVVESYNRSIAFNMRAAAEPQAGLPSPM